MTPLRIAVGNGDLAIAQSLLDHSADGTVRCTSAETRQGTPLEVARRIDNEEMVALLQQHGAKG
jgi:ankyrin repeat protein